MVRRQKNPWKPAEDAILSEEVCKHDTDWKKISKSLPGRDRKACRQRWVNRVSPAIDRSPFTEEEDLAIVRLVGSMGTNWKKISESLPRRREVGILANRWHDTLKKQEDEKEKEKENEEVAEALLWMFQEKENEKEMVEALVGIGLEGHAPTAAAPEAQVVIKGHAPASEAAAEVVADGAALMQAIATELGKAASAAAKKAKAEDAVATAKEQLEKEGVAVNEWIARALEELDKKGKAPKAVAESEGSEIVVEDDQMFLTLPTKYHRASRRRRSRGGHAASFDARASREQVEGVINDIVDTLAVNVNQPAKTPWELAADPHADFLKMQLIFWRCTTADPWKLIPSFLLQPTWTHELW